jgi:hypothetical protein
VIKRLHLDNIKMAKQHIKKFRDKDKITQYLLLIVYRIIIDLSYSITAESYDYQNLFFDEPSSSSLVLSWVIFSIALPNIVYCFNRKALSDLVLALLSIFALIPQIVAIGKRSDYPAEYLVMIICYWVFIFLFNYLIKVPKNRFSLAKSLSLSVNIAYGAVFFAFVTMVVYSYINTGLRMHVSLIDVYDIRLEARSYSAPFPFNYILSFCDNGLAVFAVIALSMKRYLLFTVLLFGIYLNFSITGTKQIVFVALCGVIGYFFIKRVADHIKIIYVAIILSGAGLAEIFLINSLTILNLYQYRVLFIPAELHYGYFCFFYQNEKDYFRQSFLKYFLKSPYTENIQFLLGESTINDFGARANNGLFSDAYLNLGVFGIIVFPLAVVSILKIFDSVIERFERRIWFCVAIFLSFVLIGMTLSTALFTSGIIILFVLFHFFPLKTNSSETARCSKSSLVSNELASLHVNII